MDNKSIFQSRKKEIADLQNRLISDDSFDYETYLTNALNIIDTELYKHFGNDTSQYIFSRAYYIDENSNFKYHEVYSQKTSKYYNIYETGIKKAENLVLNSLSESFYSLLKERDLLGIQFYKGPKGTVEIPRLPVYSFDNENIDGLFRELDKYLSKEKENINQVYNVHRQMSLDCKIENIYTYLIRARNLEDRFNSSLFLVLSRELQLWEYQQIADYFTYIMQASIKAILKPKVKKEEWQRIAADQSHTWKNELAVLSDLIGKMKDKDENFEQYAHTASQYIKDLKEINDFTLKLSQYENANDENSQIKEAFKRERVNVQKCLLAILDTLEKTTEPIGRGDKYDDKTHSKVLRERAIPSLREQIKKTISESITVFVVQKGFEIIMKELLKNTLYYSNTENPIVKVEFKRDPKDKNFFGLHFKNNGSVSSDDEAMLRGTSMLSNNGRVSYGHRLINRIIDFQYFYPQPYEKKWLKNYSKNNEEIDIYLKIYKNHISGNTPKR